MDPEEFMVCEWSVGGSGFSDECGCAVLLSSLLVCGWIPNIMGRSLAGYRHRRDFDLGRRRRSKIRKVAGKSSRNPTQRVPERDGDRNPDHRTRPDANARPLQCDESIFIRAQWWAASRDSLF